MTFSRRRSPKKLKYSKHKKGVIGWRRRLRKLLTQFFFGGKYTVLSALSTKEHEGVRTIDFVSADNKIFLHKQIQEKNGRIYMRLKKRQLF